MNLTIAEILKATDGVLIRGEVNTTITQISTDSRTVESGGLFFALIGEKFDGHHFLEQAQQKGAIGVVISREIDMDLPIIIQVKDTLVALGNTANWHRRKFDLPAVAITGSNGKTTTKDMTASVLAQRFVVFKSEKSYNNQIGIPARLLQLTDTDEIAVLEIGTSWPGEIERLAQMVEPTVGVITNIGSTHLELLGSIHGVAKEKGALLEHVDHGILNADDPMMPVLLRRTCGQITTFGWQTDADVSAQTIEIDDLGRPSFTLQISKPGERSDNPPSGNVERIHLPCLGKHNISNALAAACVGLWAGLTSTQIRIGLESYRPVEMRMQAIKHNGLHIINDAYNSNPDALKYALAFLSDMETDGKRIAILGDMLELSEHSYSLHLEAGQNISTNISLLITVGPHSRAIARGAEGRVASIISCETPNAAVVHLHKYAQAGDAVLIKGSRGMKLEQILEGLMRET